MKPQQLLQTSAVTAALPASCLHGFPSATVLSRRLKSSDEVSWFLSLHLAANAEQPEKRQLLHMGWTHALTPAE